MLRYYFIGEQCELDIENITRWHEDMDFIR